MAKQYSTKDLHTKLVIFSVLSERLLQSADEMLMAAESEPASVERDRDVMWLRWFCTAWHDAEERPKWRQVGTAVMLADAFSKEVRNAFTKGEIAEMRRGLEGVTTIPPLQDRCDANQLMCNAAKEIGLDLFDGDGGTMSDEAIDCVNEAWALAEKNGFRY